MTNLWVWTWHQKAWCTDVQRHMYRGEDAEVKSRHLNPLYPQRLGRPGLQMTCEKRGHLFISQHSFIKKTWGKFNLCFLVEFRFLAQTAWSFLFLSGFSIRLVLGHLLDQSIKLLTHSRPKIEFYLFAIAYLPTLFPLLNFFFFAFPELFFFFFFFFCCITFWLKYQNFFLFFFFFLQENRRIINLK